VTGGSRGIGLAIAHRFVDDGAHVAIVGRDAEVLDKAVNQLSANGGHVIALTADISTAAAAEAVFERLLEWVDHLDVLVNNAAIAEEAAFVDVTRESFQRVIDVNLYGPLVLMQRAVDAMPHGGSIVNITSIDAYGADGPFCTYGASKAALVNLTRSAAVELAEKGIRVNSVSPGVVMTEMNEQVLPPALIEQLKSNFGRAPIRRTVTTEEVAAAVHFLACPAASGITGTDLIVDGGTHANLYLIETLDAGASV
jgi:NAD(P)-dependent dehydrogenase (short-subunit alcohol dehydrogenase family)